LCIFSQGIDCKSGLPLDEFVQTCDAFILLNNSHLEIVPETQWPVKELETWSTKGNSFTCSQYKMSRRKMRSLSKQIEFFLQLKLSSQVDKFLFRLQQVSCKHCLK